MALLTRCELGKRILDGQHLIIYDTKVLRIPASWLDVHPGGSLVLLHFVGRDATAEIDAYHNDLILPLVKKYSIGTLAEPGPWDPLLPPIAAGWIRKDGKWLSEATTWNVDSNQILLVANDSPALRKSAPTIETLTPPPSKLSLQVQEQHATAYKTLHKRITDAGLYKTPYLTGYGPEFVRYVSLGLISAYAFRHDWLLTSAVALGLMWHLLVFFVHDLGHMGVTGNWNIDRLISILIADFIGGLSVAWWVDNHNVHHLVTNHPSHDPDIQYLPFLAISPAFFSNLYSSYYKRIFPFDFAARFIIPLQHKLFYVLMLFARFNLYRLSYVSMFYKLFERRRARGGRWAICLEIIGIIFFWGWFGGIVLRGCGSWKMAMAYAFVSHAATSFLHVQFVLSHFGMSTEDLGPVESFPHRQLRTTTDVICPEQWGFIYGGLHLQVTHHLFPRLPRHNLKKASLIVKEFAKEEGLTYVEFGFVSANHEVVGVLREVAGLASSLGEQVKMMAEVASVEAREAVDKKIAQQEAAFAGRRVANSFKET
ncbi:delta 8-sphingoloid desaturase protein [Gymnopus androsaceus JB14]|uniref:Delta 8-(E)-sphingolipid desaturase n=1 Tax=Gymnopus androsaceus JB14 TaxID=1447944 RepID=A0A6A4GWA7_9AGAR|nr:delta 8-sphingoloid desaturase protein [Gymnopus androsaceus JB14]